MTPMKNKMQRVKYDSYQNPGKPTLSRELIYERDVKGEWIQNLSMI